MMEQNLYREVSHTMPESSLEKWDKISNEIEKAEQSLFKYEVSRWVKDYIEKGKYGV